MVIVVKKIVLPGEVIAERPLRIENTYVEGGKTYAAVMGLLDEDRFIPLASVYIPKEADLVVGIVNEARFNAYIVDLSVAMQGIINTRETRVRLNVGDIVTGEVKAIEEGNAIILTRVRKLEHGMVVEFPPAKIPRLIGKGSSMLNTIIQFSNTEICAGRNGCVWIKETPNFSKIINIFDYIIKHAHTEGLTEKVTNILKS